MLMAAVFIKCFNYNIVLLNASNYRKSRVIMAAIFFIKVHRFTAVHPNVMHNFICDFGDLPCEFLQ